MGVVSAVLKYAGCEWFLTAWNTPLAGGSSPAEMIAIVPLVAICVYMTVSSLRVKKG